MFDFSKFKKKSKGKKEDKKGKSKDKKGIDTSPSKKVMKEKELE